MIFWSRPPSWGFLHFAPDELWVEGLGSEDGADDDAAEGEEAGSGNDGRQFFEFHQRDEDGDDEDVEHGPASHGINHAVHPDALEFCAGPFELDRGDQGKEADQLEERDKDAGEEDDDRDGVIALLKKAASAIPRGVVGGSAVDFHVEDGEKVGGEIKDEGGKGEGGGHVEAGVGPFFDHRAAAGAIGDGSLG